jgi:hypothetical protein
MEVLLYNYILIVLLVSKFLKNIKILLSQKYIYTIKKAQKAGPHALGPTYFVHWP